MGRSQCSKALQASEEEDEREESPRESARRGHRRAMRHMDREGRRRYASEMPSDEEKDMVGAIAAEMDEEEDGDEREGSEDREERKDEDLSAKIASQMASWNKAASELKAELVDIRASKFTKDVTPRVANISARMQNAGLSPTAFQASVAMEGLETAISKHVPPGLQRDTSVSFDGSAMAGAPAARQASMGRPPMVSIKAILAGAA